MEFNCTETTVVNKWNERIEWMIVTISHKMHVRVAQNEIIFKNINRKWHEKRNLFFSILFFSSLCHPFKKNCNFSRDSRLFAKWASFRMHFSFFFFFALCRFACHHHDNNTRPRLKCTQKKAGETKLVRSKMFGFIETKRQKNSTASNAKS